MIDLDMELKYQKNTSLNGLLNILVFLSRQIYYEFDLLNNIYHMFYGVTGIKVEPKIGTMGTQTEFETKFLLLVATLTISNKTFSALNILKFFND